MAEIEVEAEAIVDGPPDEVFAFIADVRNNPSWQDGMVDCTWTSEGPIAQGSTYRQHARMLGRDLVSDFVVTDFQPGRSMTIQTTSGPFPITVTRRVERAAEGTTRASATIRGDAGGIFRLTAPLLRRQVERSVRADWARLPSAYAASRAPHG